MLDCDHCGAELPGTDASRPNWYHDSDALTCADCEAVNHVSCDAESDPYVSCYDCRHGKSSDDPCDQCEIEDGAGVGEVET